MESKPETVGIIYRKATLGEIIQLRNAVIIQGTERTSPEFPDDDNPSTYHIGAFLEGKTIACLSLMPFPYEEGPAFQLRGMAVDPGYQGLRVGQSLLVFAEKWVRRNTSVRLIWCNSRTAAVEFYEKQGWEQVSEEFEIECVGSHFRLIRKLGV